MAKYWTEFGQSDILPYICGVKEVFVPIRGYEGSYEISNFGRVKSLPKNIMRKNGHRYTTKERFVQIHKSNNGYCVVDLYNLCNRTTFFIHRLVAYCFLPQQDGKNHVDHIDGDRTNNRVDNLRWCSQAENNRMPLFRQRCSEGQKRRLSNPLSKKKSIPIGQYDKNWKLIRHWDSMTVASKTLKYSISNISVSCKTGQLYHGFYFKKLQL